MTAFFMTIISGGSTGILSVASAIVLRSLAVCESERTLRIRCAREVQ
jgi:hypothetical protein